MQIFSKEQYYYVNSVLFVTIHVEISMQIHTLTKRELKLGCFIPIRSTLFLVNLNNIEIRLGYVEMFTLTWVMNFIT